MTGRGPRTAAAIVVLAVAAVVARGATTRELGLDPAALLDGRPDGVAVSSDGRLSPAPVLRPLGAAGADVDAAHVWSIATDGAGAILLGTGPDGRVVRVAAGGAASILATLPEPLVTALVTTADGTLYAATSPGGTIYRVPRGGEPEPWGEAGARYVWDLATGPDGRILAATGEPGAIVRLSPTGDASTWWESTEPHVTVLRRAPDGSMLVGTAGRGTVYRLDADARPTVLHQDDLPEVADVATLPDGSVLVALIAPPRSPETRPAVRIELPSDSRFGSVAPVDGVDDTRTTTVEGFIEGLPGADRDGAAAVRGRVTRIEPDGRARELWRSADEAPFRVLPDGDGRALFGTGEPARLYVVDDDVVSRLASLDQGQVSGLLRFGRSVVLATSNPAAALTVDSDHAETGVYVSPVLDAGGPARWGSIRWTAERIPGAAEIYARTGNGAVPDDAWSAWSPVLTDPRGSRVPNPDGRYLQWRVRLPGGPGGERIGDVRVTVEPYNRDPEVGGRPEIDARRGAVRGDFDVSWSARDADGDPLACAVRLRPADGGDARTVARAVLPPDPREPAAWRRGRTTASVADLPEGRWDLTVEVDDAAANVPGEEGRAVTAPAVPVVVDRTPPTASVAGRDAGTVRVEARDGGSGLAAATVLIAGEPAHRVRPEDGVCDDAAETFVVRLPPDAPGRKLWLRLEDAAGNAFDLELVPGP